MFHTQKHVRKCFTRSHAPPPPQQTLNPEDDEELRTSTARNQNESTNPLYRSHVALGVDEESAVNLTEQDLKKLQVDS